MFGVPLEFLFIFLKNIFVFHDIIITFEKLLL